MNLPRYTQLKLWEFDGEVFTTSPGSWQDGVTVSVPDEVVENWGQVAKLSSQRQREMYAYYDAATAAAHSDDTSPLSPSFTD